MCVIQRVYKTLSFSLLRIVSRVHVRRMARLTNALRAMGHAARLFGRQEDAGFVRAAVAGKDVARALLARLFNACCLYDVRWRDSRLSRQIILM